MARKSKFFFNKLERAAPACPNGGKRRGRAAKNAGIGPGEVLIGGEGH